MYAKVFQQILDSSIAEDWQTRHVFEDLLKLCDLNGVVDMTPESISRRTNVPLDIVQKAIGILESADPRSRNPDHDGRRIVRLDPHRDWGWIIVNYQHYRNLVSEEQRREKTRSRVAKFREKTQQNGISNAHVTHGNACNAMQREKQRDKKQSKEDGANAACAVPESEIPSREEFDAHTEAYCPNIVNKRQTLYDDWLAAGWRDGTGRPIVDWKKTKLGLELKIHRNSL